METPIVVLRAMRAIVDYNWQDEQRDFEEQQSCGDLADESYHIFSSLKIVDEWLAAEADYAIGRADR